MATEAAAATNKKADEGLAPGFYSNTDKQQFKSFFVKKRKRGRPKKKKRGRPRKQKKVDNKTQCMIDLTPKAAENLDARLEKAVKASRAAVPKQASRINWDKEPHFSLRKRVADSWILKKDLWTKGETLRKFCERMHVSRPVLCRYLPKRKKELESGNAEEPSKRGRKTHLSESVMRHICEGVSCFFVCIVVYCLLNYLPTHCSDKAAR